MAFWVLPREIIFGRTSEPREDDPDRRHHQVPLQEGYPLSLQPWVGLAEFQDINDLSRAPEERSKGYTINTATIEYQTEKMHFCHIDCPGHTDYQKNTVIGAARMDTGILVVSAEGQDKQTKEHVLIAKYSGVGSIVVYINKADLVKDKEMLDIVELEVRDMLTSYGYDGKNAFVVRGSALCALEGGNKELGDDSIAQLLNVLDTKMPLPVRHTELPFVMHVDHTIPISVCSGLARFRRAADVA